MAPEKQKQKQQEEKEKSPSSKYSLGLIFTVILGMTAFLSDFSNINWERIWHPFATTDSTAMAPPTAPADEPKPGPSPEEPAADDTNQELEKVEQQLQLLAKDVRQMALYQELLDQFSGKVGVIRKDPGAAGVVYPTLEEYLQILNSQRISKYIRVLALPKAEEDNKLRVSHE